MVVCAVQHLCEASAVLLPRVGRREFIGPPTPAPLKARPYPLFELCVRFLLKVWLKGMTFLDVTPSLWCGVGKVFQ